MCTKSFQMYKLGLVNAEEPEIKLPIFFGSYKKQGNSRKNIYFCFIGDFPGGLDGKASVCNAGDLGSTPGSGRSPGEGNGKPPQYLPLENPMDRGTW